MPDYRSPGARCRIALPCSEKPRKSGTNPNIRNLNQPRVTIRALCACGLRMLDPGPRATYQMRMPVRLLRQILSMLLVAAYLSATIFATAPVAYAAPSEMSGG